MTETAFLLMNVFEFIDISLLKTVSIERNGVMQLLVRVLSPVAHDHIGKGRSSIRPNNFME